MRERLATWFKAGKAAVIARMPGSTNGSKARNLLSFLALFWAVALFLEAVFAAYGVPLFVDGPVARIFAIFWSLMACVVFSIICVGIVFLHSQSKPIRAGRLLRDTAFSSGYTVCSFALLFRYIGVKGEGADGLALCFASGDVCTCNTGPIDHLYLSLVTFTTLGYGDLSLCQYRLVAGLEALLGNLHLGIFVGAVFYYLSEAGRSGNRSALQNQSAQQQSERTDRAEDEQPEGKANG